MRGTNLLAVVAVFVLVGVVATALMVYAQPGAAPGAPVAPGAGPGGGGRGGQGGPGMRGMGMMAGMTPLMTVANNKVYVLFMGTLFMVNSETLEIQKQVRLVPEGFPAMPPGGGGGPVPPPAAPQ